MTGAPVHPRTAYLAAVPRTLAPIVAATAVIAVGIAAWPFTVDDAYVVARYALSGGYAMNAGDAPTDGVTGPLWLLPGLAAHALHLDPVVAAKGLGLALAALAAALVVHRAARSQGGRRSAWWTALLVAASPTLGVWGAAGLETGAATLSLTVAALAATTRRGSANHPKPQERDEGGGAAGMTTGVALAALAWLRPECAVAATAVLAILLLRDRRAGLVAVALAAVGAASVVAFRLALFDHALPMSLAAKPALLMHGAAYALRSLLFALPSVGLMAAGIPDRGGRMMMKAPVRSDLLLLAVVLAHMGAVVVAGGDWMPGFRLVAPVIPIAALVVGRTVTRIARRRRALAAGLLALSLFPALTLFTSVPDARDAGHSRETVGRELATWLAAHARTVALVDVGYLPWASGVAVVDLGGITEPRVAYAPGAHLAKRVDEAWLRARSPDVIVLHADAPPGVGDGTLRALAGWPVERRVAMFRFVRQRYRVARVVRYADAYWYVALVRVD